MSSVAMRRLSLLAVAAAVGASAIVVSPAAAAEGDDLLIFSNENVVDTSSIVDGGELAYLSEQLVDMGFVLTEFDGGDGSAGAWTDALVGIEAIVFPEDEEGDLFVLGADGTDAWMSDAAAAVIATWVQAGGTILISGHNNGTSNEEFLSIMTGADFTGAWSNTDSNTSAARVIGDVSLPDPLPYANGTYAPDLSTWPTSASDLLTPWYVDGDFLWAGSIAAGSGAVGMVAYDYFPRPGEDDPICDVAGDSAFITYDWNTVVSALLDGGDPTVPAYGTWTGTGDEFSITVEHGSILGSGAWANSGPGVWRANDRPVDVGTEIDGNDFVENPSNWDGCLAVDIDPDAQTITITDLTGGSSFGAARIEVSSPELTGISLVNDGLFDYDGSDWSLEWSVSSGTLIADWRSSDLTAYASDEEADPADAVIGGSTVFSYAPQLAATGSTDVQPWALAGLALLFAGAVVTVLSRKTSVDAS